MNSIILQLPQTLQRQLETLARNEGVSLDQYVLYALTWQVAVAWQIHLIPAEQQHQERDSFDNLLRILGQASADEIDRLLAEREQVQPEAGLSAEVVARLQARLNSESTVNG